MAGGDVRSLVFHHPRRALIGAPQVLAPCSGGRLPVPPGQVLRSQGRWPQIAGTAVQLRQPPSIHLPGHAADGRSPHHLGRCLYQRHALPPGLVTDAPRYRDGGL
jgi:hypothetical protein